MGAFSSEFGKRLGGLIKGENLLGNVYYILMAVISYGSFWENFNASKMRLFLSIASELPCFWLAYVLMFILHDRCSICITMYGINAALIWINWQKFVELKNHSKKRV